MPCRDARGIEANQAHADEAFITFAIKFLEQCHVDQVKEAPEICEISLNLCAIHNADVPATLLVPVNSLQAADRCVLKC